MMNRRSLLFCIIAVFAPAVPPTSPTFALTHEWSQNFTSTGNNEGRSVAIAANQDVIVVGFMKASVDFGGGALTSAGDEDVFLVRFDKDGNHLWSQRFGDGDGESGRGVSLDRDGNILIIGRFEGTLNLGGATLVSAGGRDVFVAKFSPAGAHMWSLRYGGVGQDWVGADYPTGHMIACDGAGSVVVTGALANAGVDIGGGPLATEGFYVAKFDSAGAHVWSQTVGASHGYDITTDSQHNVIAVGGDPLSPLPLMVKFDAGGNQAWSTNDLSIFPEAVVADQTGNIVTVGCASTSASAIESWSPDGVRLWTRAITTAGLYLPPWGNGIAVDQYNNIFICGAIYEPSDFGGGPLVPPASFLEKVYLAAFASDGSHLWSDFFSEDFDDFSVGFDLTVGPSNEVVMTGEVYGGYHDFGGGPLPSGGPASVTFLAKFDTTSLVPTGIRPDVSRAVENTSLLAYPNPFNPTATIRFNLNRRQHVRVTIFDVRSRRVRVLANRPFDAGSQELQWRGKRDDGTPVSSGVYFVRVESSQFNQTAKIVFLK